MEYKYAILYKTILCSIYTDKHNNIELRTIYDGMPMLYISSVSHLLNHPEITHYKTLKEAYIALTDFTMRTVAAAEGVIEHSLKEKIR